jgi:adenosylcobyric acid synthase
MMFSSLDDKYALENETAIIEEGFGFIDDVIVFEKEKTLEKKEYEIFDCKISGFEIHHGASSKYPLYFEKENIKGTFAHAIFDNDNLRYKLFKAINSNYQGFDFEKYKQNTINSFISLLKEKIDIETIKKGIYE